jgi:hypothetical protein
MSAQGAELPEPHENRSGRVAFSGVPAPVAVVHRRGRWFDPSIAHEWSLSDRIPVLGIRSAASRGSPTCGYVEDDGGSCPTMVMPGLSSLRAAAGILGGLIEYRAGMIFGCRQDRPDSNEAGVDEQDRHLRPAPTPTGSARSMTCLGDSRSVGHEAKIKRAKRGFAARFGAQPPGIRPSTRRGHHRRRHAVAAGRQME